MIIVGIGANLNHPVFGAPRRTCGAALEHLSNMPRIRLGARSSWYQSAPVLRIDGILGEHPWYVNGAVEVLTDLPPVKLLDTLMDVETVFGRVRSVTDAPRTLDLDLVAYHEEQIDLEVLTIPHPRLLQRAFVVLPLADLDNQWAHPATGAKIAEIADNLPDGQDIDRMTDADGLFGTEWQATHVNNS